MAIPLSEIIEINAGTFEFSTSENEFPIIINVSSNTNFLLDVLTELDNERAEKQGLRDMGAPRWISSQIPSPAYIINLADFRYCFRKWW